MEKTFDQVIRERDAENLKRCHNRGMTPEAIDAMQAENVKLRMACEDCLEIMEIIYPRGLPIQQGTLCEEDMWYKAVKRAKIALGKDGAK